MKKIFYAAILLSFNLVIASELSPKDDAATKKDPVSQELNKYFLPNLGKIIKEYALPNNIIIRFEAKDEKEEKAFAEIYGLSSPSDLLVYEGILSPKIDGNDLFRVVTKKANFKVNDDMIIPALGDSAHTFRINTAFRSENILESAITESNINNFIINRILYNSLYGHLYIPVKMGYKYIIRHASCTKDQSNVKLQNDFLAKFYCVQEVRQDV